MRSLRPLVVVALALLGCDGAPDLPGPGAPEDDFLDLRVELPDAPDPEDGALFEVPWMEVGPGEEKLFCLYGTYEGPTTGVNSLRPAYPSRFHHHGLLKRGTADDPPDGTIIDCTDVEEQWPPRPTLFERVGGGPDPDEWINLPDGIAFRLEQGQRWMADVHYVNTGREPIVLNYGFLLGFVPLDDVRAIAGTFNMDAGGFSIPPGEAGSEEFGCAWHDDLTVLSLGGHMHGFGTSYEVTHEAGDERATVYDVPQWREIYRFEPPMTNFDDGALTVAEGDLFHTSCNWLNRTSAPLEYPEEMCTTFGVAYPLEENYYCDGGNVTIGGGGASIRGVLRRDVVIPGDGVGDVNIFLSDTEPVPGIPPSEGQTFILDDVDLSDPDGSVPFLLTKVFQNEAPLFLVAYLDDDASGVEGGPTPGDPVVLMQGLAIDAAEEFEIDIVFDLVVPEGDP